MTDFSPDAQLMDAAQAIHADNLHLLDRLAASDCNPGIELDNTLNGAQEHIFRFFEALALYRYGTVPWRSVRFMLDSTETLVRAIEARFHMPSAHAVGQTFRASKIWWCVDKPVPKVTRKAYLKNLFAARESFYAALNAFNCDIFCQGSPPPQPPPPAQTPPQRAATKSDLRAAVSFTTDDRRTLRNMNDMMRKLLKPDCGAKLDRRPAEEREWIGKAVRLYILRHDIEARSETTFSAVCKRYWSRAKAHFKDAKQYTNKVTYDYNNFYDIDAEKRKIKCGIESVT